MGTRLGDDSENSNHLLPSPSSTRLAIVRTLCSLKMPKSYPWYVNIYSVQGFQYSDRFFSFYSPHSLRINREDGIRRIAPSTSTLKHALCTFLPAHLRMRGLFCCAFWCFEDGMAYYCLEEQRGKCITDLHCVFFFCVSLACLSVVFSSWLIIRTYDVDSGTFLIPIFFVFIHHSQVY